jgi:predicted nucleotidyltransferase
MMENVSSDALAEVVHRIIQAVHPEQILLFGSQAWGQPNEESDIDLLVVLGTSSEPGYRRAREVYRSLRGIRLPIEVVVRTRDEMIRAGRVPTSLERQALDRGRLLYG